MAVVDLEHLPEGVVLLADPVDAHTQIGPQRWVEASRRRVPRQLGQRVAEHLSSAREQDEV